MPIIKSAKKALRQSIVRGERNLQRRKAFKLAVKEARELKMTGKTDDALKTLPTAYKAIDKAVKAGVMKKGTAARKKSRLAKLINKK